MHRNQIQLTCWQAITLIQPKVDKKSYFLLQSDKTNWSLTLFTLILFTELGTDREHCVTRAKCKQRHYWVFVNLSCIDNGSWFYTALSLTANLCHDKDVYLQFFVYLIKIYRWEIRRGSKSKIITPINKFFISLSTICFLLIY